MRVLRYSIAGLALGSVLAAGCSDETTAPQALRQPGVLLISGWTGNVPTTLTPTGENVVWNREPGAADYSAPDVLVAPDTVNAGEAFVVTTNTVGASGCWRADGQTVSMLARMVVLKPYDAHSGSEICTMALVFPAHHSTVILTEPGEWTLRVDGRRLRLGDDRWEEPISAQRKVFVR